MLLIKHRCRTHFNNLCHIKEPQMMIQNVRKVEEQELYHWNDRVYVFTSP